MIHSQLYDLTIEVWVDPGASLQHNFVLEVTVPAPPPQFLILACQLQLTNLSASLVSLPLLPPDSHPLQSPSHICSTLDHVSQGPLGASNTPRTVPGGDE